MTETTDGLPAQSTDELSLDAIDDVEAHGLREVAAAATIGAAVIGAGGAALAASSAHVGTAPKTPAIVQQTMNDTHQLARDAARSADDLTRGVTTDSEALAGHALTTVHKAVDPTVNQVTGDTYRITTDATTLTRDATRYVDKTAASEVDAADQVVGSAEKLATDTVRTATATVKTTTDTATSTVRTVKQSTLKLVSATVDSINKGWDLKFDVLGRGVSAGGNMLTPTGTVSITDGQGHVLGTAKVTKGECAIHLSTLGKSQSLEVHYSGDGNFGATALQWQAPVGL